MKREPHFLPPRQTVIYRHTRQMLDETGMNANTFAMHVAERYLQLVAPDVRNVPFRMGEGDDLIAAMKANGQTLRRYMDGTVKVLPADLEDAWVMALPVQYRQACERDLAQRRGLLSVAVPTGDGAKVFGLGELTTEFAELLQALSPALADGRICEQDLPHARRILSESDDLISQVLALRRQITALLPEGSVHA